MLKSLDFLPDSLVPRMTWLYDSEQRTFTYTIPAADVDAAQPFGHKDLPLEVADLPNISCAEAIKQTAIETAAGSITPIFSDNTVSATLWVKPLPTFDPVDESLPYLQKRAAANKTRTPQLQDLAKLYHKLSELSLVQSRFGIPRENFDTSIALPAARIAFKMGAGRLRPFVVVTKAFQEAQDITMEDGDCNAATNAAKTYIRHFDPESHDTEMATQLTMLPDVFIHLRSGCVCFGRRDGGIDTSQQYEPSIMRYQSGDAYEATLHNMGPPYFSEAVMATVGTLNRIARDQSLVIAPSQL